MVVSSYGDAGESLSGCFIWKWKNPHYCPIEARYLPDIPQIYKTHLKQATQNTFKVDLLRKYTFMD